MQVFVPKQLLICYHYKDFFSATCTCVDTFTTINCQAILRDTDENCLVSPNRFLFLKLNAQSTMILVAKNSFE